MSSHSIAAINFFASKLMFETDPADLAAQRVSTSPPVVIDTRSLDAWKQGHIPGAVHILGVQLREDRDEVARQLPDLDTDIVVYCWGPGCNGATRAALALSDLGYRHVRELIGGFEYWAREGFAVRGGDGKRSRRPVDPLTAPLPSHHCP